MRLVSVVWIVPLIVALAGLRPARAQIAPAQTAPVVPAPIDWASIPAAPTPWSYAVNPPQTPAPQAAASIPQTPKAFNPHHIFFIIPAYDVASIRNAKPLSTHEKWVEFVQDTYDPTGLVAGAIEAYWLEDNHGNFCDYGRGWGGYSKCFGAALVDANVSGLIGDYLLPSWWHQDPRYFRLGTGSVANRFYYALTRVFIARKDNGGWTFASGATTGTVAAGFISNLYYPKVDRGWGLSLSRIEIDLLGTAIFNEEAEFWPDIERVVFRRHSRPLSASVQ